MKGDASNLEEAVDRSTASEALLTIDPKADGMVITKEQMELRSPVYKIRKVTGQEEAEPGTSKQQAS